MKYFHTSLLSRNLSLSHPEEFASFYEQTHLNVFRYAMVLCGGNQAEAEDITAEAFFRAWEKRQHFSGTLPAALGWVITITRNLLIDYRRGETAHPVATIPEEAESNDGNSIENMLVDEEQMQQVLEAIYCLPFPQQDIFTLRYILSWRVKDIATHFGMAENTVSVELRRALMKLQKQLILPETNAGRGE